jgi:hypothetical protein
MRTPALVGPKVLELDGLKQFTDTELVVFVNAYIEHGDVWDQIPTIEDVARVLRFTIDRTKQYIEGLRSNGN